VDIRFINNCNTQFVITKNYSAMANFHILQFIRTHAKVSVCCVFSGRVLVTASNNGYSFASRLKPTLNGGSLPTELFLLQLSSVKYLCMDRVENTVSSSTSILAFLSFAAGTCLASRCLETAVVYLFISQSLHSNRSTRYKIL
jgi:hypothetical protein